MTTNDDPLEYRDTTVPRALMYIVEQSDTRIVLRSPEAAVHNLSSLGALLSADRSIVYWTNTTNPLP